MKQKIMSNRAAHRTAVPEFGEHARRSKGHAGFTLVEVTIALLIIMVAFLGVFATFTYAIQYNAGNKSRSQALSVLQQEVETMRAAKFTSTGTPDAVLLGGQHAMRTVTAVNGRVFTVQTNVDNDPSVTGVQDESYVCLTPQGAATTCAIKEIEIVVALAAPSQGWQTSVPARVLMRRVRGN
ncbi:MAG: prepilin-type N-terminal cleavage/methylation domain-containing protein [Acidobacteriota bacterium]